MLEDVAPLVDLAALYDRRAPETAVIAMRSAFAPSIANSSGRSGESPRSTRSESKARTTVELSVVPSRSPRTCFWPQAVDAQRNPHHVFVEVAAVDLHDPQVQVAERL